MRLGSILALGAGSVLAFSACQRATAPGETALLRVVMLDDPASLVASRPPSSAWLAHHKTFGADYFHGTLTPEVQVLVSTDGLSFVPLTAAGGVSVDLQDETSEAVGPGGRVPSDTYRFVRLVLRGTRATLATGSQFGGAEVEVDEALPVGDAPELVIDSALPSPLLLLPNGESTLAIDLNSESWDWNAGFFNGHVDGHEVAAGLSIGIRAAAATVVAI